MTAGDGLSAYSLIPIKLLVLLDELVYRLGRSDSLYRRIP